MTASTATASPTSGGAALAWDELDQRAVDTLRALAMDAVEQAGNGHPGTAMSLAPAAYLLFQRHLRHDPADPAWDGRDRFVLSCGHSSLTLYLQLYFSGYGLTLDDLKAFRTWGSLTPGHPEHGHTAGVETTTGPLGQGIGNAVGMAMAARRERGLLDPAAADGQSVFDHHVYVIASDGDLQEGVSAEASSLAGHQKLGNLTLIWDDNRISIEGDTELAFSEDVAGRYAAYGWHVQTVDVLPSGDIDLPALDAALTAARAETARPSFIALRSVIAWPAPNAQNTGASHGAALGADEIAATKRVLGLDPAVSFAVPDDVLAHAREVAARGAETRAAWDARLQEWSTAHPDHAALYERLRTGALPDGWADALPVFDADAKGMATRSASGKVIAALADVLPELWGGSADLAGSNNTTIPGAGSFLPASSRVAGADPAGRLLHFGIREHAMGAVMNGVALHGRSRIYGGTFLVFSDYMRPSVRLAALMELPVTYVWTHDSIGVGEDGPTHQPVEHVASLRLIPGLDVIRPGDANEVAWAWRTVITSPRPAALCLTRQNLPVLDRTVHAAADGVARGGYVLAEADGGSPQVVLVATGSELALAVEARERLQDDGVPTRVVSLPCLEWFRAQDAAYRESVIPSSVRARVSVEAGVTHGWREIVGDGGRSVGLDHYGASAPAGTLFREFGITADAVVEAARSALDDSHP
jgi:transketolase